MMTTVRVAQHYPALHLAHLTHLQMSRFGIRKGITMGDLQGCMVRDSRQEHFLLIWTSIGLTFARHAVNMFPYLMDIFQFSTLP